MRVKPTFPVPTLLGHPKGRAALGVLGIGVLAAALLSPSSSARGASSSVELAETSASEIRADAQALGALGVYWDKTTQEVVVVGQRDGPTIGASAFGKRGVRVRSETAQVSTSDFQFATDTLMALESAGTLAGEATTIGVDLQSGQIEITSTASKSTFSAVFDRLGRGAYFQSGEGDFTWLSRADDFPPYWGGAVIEHWNGHDFDHCSSGFSVLKGGGAYMLSAGHCYSLGWSIVDGGSDAYGTVNYVAPYPSRDMLLIGGQKYGGYIYRGVPGASEGTGHVTSAGDPTAGFNYCSSGAYTKEVCGIPAVQVGVTGCDAGGHCTGNMVKFSGESWWQVGDSGGPIFGTTPGSSDVHARAIISFFFNGSSFGQDWSAVPAQWPGTTICTVQHCN